MAVVDLSKRLRPVCAFKHCFVETYTHVEHLTSVRRRSLVLARKVNILICTARCGGYSESALIISVNKTGVRVQACLDVHIFLNDIA